MSIVDFGDYHKRALHQNLTGERPLPAEPQKRSPNPVAVEMLQDILASVQAGEITGFILVGWDKPGQRIRHATVFDPTAPGNPLALIGGLEVAKANIVDSQTKALGGYKITSPDGEQALVGATSEHDPA